MTKNSFTTTEILSGSKALAQSYLRGDVLCLGSIPRNDVVLISENIALYAPYIPLQITPVILTKVVHCKKEPYDIYIGRGKNCKWGNPFSHKIGTLAKFKVETRQQSIEEYEKWIRQQPELMAALPELKDKILGCWCKPQACHGDVLVKLVKEMMYKNQMFFDWS
jgi:hypothetical protein